MHLAFDIRHKSSLLVFSELSGVELSSERNRNCFNRERNFGHCENKGLINEEIYCAAADSFDVITRLESVDVLSL